MQFRRQLPLPGRALSGALLLLPACGIGPGVIGDATETDLATDAGSDTEGMADGTETGQACTEDCDPDFALSVLTSVNFRGRNISLYGFDTCQGPNCPADLLPSPPLPETPLHRCQDSEEAQSSPVGVEEYCRLNPTFLSPLLAFQTPVDPDSFDPHRPRPGDPAVDEGYLWRTSVVRIEGPGTAFRGDYYAGQVGAPDRLEVLVNLSCAERLTAEGIAWTEDQLETLCVGTWDDGGVLRPLRMAPAMVFDPTRGQLRTTSGSSCDTPEAGPDTCCSSCDLLLSAQIARYGVDDGGVARNSNEGSAIACDPASDPLVECRDLILEIDRSDSTREYVYPWEGETETWLLPWYDKIRETHPDDRPPGIEVLGAPCINAGGCATGLSCIGTNPLGQACLSGEDCTDRICRSEWFGTCGATEGGDTYCHDRRFSARGAGACLAATADFGSGSEGERLAQCDANGDGTLTSSECCDAALGGGPRCDPYMQSGLETIDRYDRNPSLTPDALCTCSEGEPDSCQATLDAWCEAPLGSATDPGPASPEGHYAAPLVARIGGIRWSDESGQVDLRLANAGNLLRADTESCAEARGLIGERNTTDGWLANENVYPELVVDHDLQLCSGSSYRMIFAESDAEFHILSAAGGTLDGRSEHVFETPQFRVMPYSLFPSDNLTISSCEHLTMGFTAHYDLSASNLNKIEIREGSVDGPRVAGGTDCSPDATPPEIALGAIPCLTTDIADRNSAELGFVIDREIHGDVLVAGTTYAIVVPGLAEIGQLADTDAYAAAFHDACGMPLVVGDTQEVLQLSEVLFTVDEPCSAP